MFEEISIHRGREATVPNDTVIETVFLGEPQQMEKWTLRAREHACKCGSRVCPDYGITDLKLFLDGVVSLIDLQMVISAAEAFATPRG